MNFKNNFLQGWCLLFHLFGELLLMLLRVAFCTIDEMLTKIGQLWLYTNIFGLFDKYPGVQ